MEKEIIIIDDDNVFANILKIKIEKYYTGRITILNTFDYSYLKARKPYIDLAWVDVELGNCFENGVEQTFNGIEEVIKLREMDFWELKVIFITNHPNFVYNSFDANPLYFISKSELDTRFKLAIKLLEQRGFRKQNVYKYKDALIDINEMIYAESFDHDIYFYMCGNAFYKIRAKMEDIEKDLLKMKCHRIHKSIIVNYKFVKVKYSNKVILQNGTTLTISRTYREQFKEAYKKEKLRDFI